MPRRMRKPGAPVVKLVIELTSTLAHVTSAPALGDGLASDLADTLMRLGIPGQPDVEILTMDCPPHDDECLLRIWINGRRCRFPHELLDAIWCYVHGAQLEPLLGPAELRRQLEIAPLTSSEDPQAQNIAIIRLICREAIKRQPGLLLGPDQAAAYCEALARVETPDAAPAGWPPDANWLLPILRRVVDLNIAIADQQTIAGLLRSAGQRPQEDIVELLIAALRPDIIDIYIEAGYLRQLTTDNEAQGPDLFPFLRDGMFAELGMTYPPFRFVAVDTLTRGSFAFSINHLTTTPLIGLPPGKYFVNDSADRLKVMGIEGTTTINPASLSPGSVVDTGTQATVESAGWTTWDQMGYFILCFASVLRRYSGCLLDSRVVQEQISRLQSAYPALIQTVLSYVPIERITRTMRGLLSDGVSIRNLRLILELLVEHALLAPSTDPSEFVRAGMREELGNKYARSTSTVVVYLLDPQIEQMLLTQSAPVAGDLRPDREEQEVDALVAAIRTEMAYLPATVQTPLILTSQPVRQILRPLLASELPRLTAIAYGDLPPDKNVQPVARISLR